MRIPIILLLLAIEPAGAQNPRPAAAITSPMAVAPRRGIAWQTFTELEKSFDSRLAKTGGAQALDILGNTRGLYLDDYGVVFTTELSLIVTPGLNPFRKTEISKEEVAEVRRLKLENLPKLKTVMREMVKTTAMTFGAAGASMGILKPNAQVVLAVRLRYLPYENTIGLPGLIVMKADLKGALNNDITVDEQF